MFDDLLLVAAVAFTAPFLLGLKPSLRLPSVVLEILAGIVIGPSVLGLVEVDQTLEVIALVGLAFVLFLEIELDKLRGPVLRLTALGFAASFAIALVVALGLQVGGLIETPLLVAIILCATSLGVLIPVLKDAGEIDSTFGQLVIAAASVADFGAIILLSIFFSGEGGTGATLVLLGSVFALAGVVFVVTRGAERSMRIRDDLVRLQDTTAQIRVRGAFLLFVAFAAVAEQLGLEVILGAFIAGAIVSLVDRDEVMTHPNLRRKLEAVGFGVFIPAFFVTSGVRFDLDALTSSASNLLMVPIFLAALLAARGLPALVYRRVLDGRHTAVAALLQATSLPFIVAATAIGMDLGLIDAAGSAALIGAGLLSVLLFPLAGLVALRNASEASATEPHVHRGGFDVPDPAHR
jgi:Kef-type K+ transport system membrane component KefB